MKERKHGKIVAFFRWKFRSFAFGKKQKIGYKTEWYPVHFTIRFYSALRAANFQIIGQKAAVELGFPWVAAAKKLEFSVWSCLYDEVRTYFKGTGS